MTSILEHAPRRHRPANPGFQVINQGAVREASDQSTQVFTTLLGAVAAISLLVGGIGVMNIMLVSVTERTREIGIRKAIGARRADILTQFLTEAVLVSLLGGLRGRRRRDRSAASSRSPACTPVIALYSILARLRRGAAVRPVLRHLPGRARRRAAPDRRPALRMTSRPADGADMHRPRPHDDARTDDDWEPALEDDAPPPRSRRRLVDAADRRRSAAC